MRSLVPYRPRLVYFAAGICFLCGFYFVKDFLQQSFNRNLLTHEGTEQPSQEILNAEFTRSTRHLLSSDNKRETCTPPAILEFPRCFMNNDQRLRGGFLICLIIALYMFWAIAIVCDDYFVPALDVICEKMNLQTDVAGATFMALGSSAPELFASMIGVFITKGDIGTGTILGSAVFNVLFVIGVCGLFSGQVLQLSWWPIVRDLMSYLLALLVLILVIMDGVVMWYEAVIMMCSYSLYLVLMFFNPQLERFAYRITNTAKHGHTPEHHLGYTGLAPARDVGDDDICAQHHHHHVHDHEERMRLIEEIEGCPEMEKTGDTGTSNKDDPTSVDELNSSQVKERSFEDDKNLDVEKADMGITNKEDATLSENKTTGEIAEGETRSTMESSTLLDITKNSGMKDGDSQKEKLPNKGDESSSDSDSEFDLALGSPLHPPTGHWKRLGWGLSLPINLCFYFTIPDVRKPSCHKWCPVTFIACVAWIAITSYILVWMVTLIGFTFGVPDTVMGLTLVAFGSSVPDCMSSLFVAKKGDGDMACSHTVGSNVFDIFLCLGIPWTIKTTVLSTKSSLALRSHGLFISSFFIMASIILTFLMMHFHDWKLTKRVGLVYIVVYLIFITIACVVELNVFGYFNPPMCKISSSV